MKRRNFLKAVLFSPIAALIRPGAKVTAGVPPFSGVYDSERLNQLIWACDWLYAKRQNAIEASAQRRVDTICSLYATPCVVNVMVDRKPHRIIAQ